MAAVVVVARKEGVVMARQAGVAVVPTLQGVDAAKSLNSMGAVKSSSRRDTTPPAVGTGLMPIMFLRRRM
jgi:hypothetical protein